MENNHPVSSTGAVGRVGAVRPFRFGVVAAAARSADEWVARARRAEALGYATLVMPDNLQHTLAPLPALAMAAAATRTLRIGTYVLANDLRHPVLLAKDVATLDLLSGGRFELGLGAGRPDAAAENRMLGLPFDSGAVRVARLAESIGIVKALLAGQRVSTSGDVLRRRRRRGVAAPCAAAARAHPGRRQRPPDAQSGRARGGHHRPRTAARRHRGDGRRTHRLDPRSRRRPIRRHRAEHQPHGRRRPGASLDRRAAAPDRAGSRRTRLDSGRHRHDSSRCASSSSQRRERLACPTCWYPTS